MLRSISYPLVEDSRVSEHLFRSQFRMFPKDRFGNRKPTNFMEQCSLGNDLDLFVIKPERLSQRRGEPRNPFGVTPRTRVLFFERLAPYFNNLR